MTVYTRSECTLPRVFLNCRKEGGPLLRCPVSHCFDGSERLRARSGLLRLSALFAAALLTIPLLFSAPPLPGLALAKASASTDTASVASRSADGVPLLSRKLVFGSPERTGVQISPDGAYISFLAPKDGVLNLWVGPSHDPAAAQPATDDRGRGIQSYFWTYLPHHLVYAQDTDGDENWTLYSLNVVTGAIRLLTPPSGVQAELVAASPQHPETIVVNLNERLPQHRDLYRIHVATGERTLLYENEGLLNFVLDGDYRIRFATEPTSDGGHLILERADEQWRPFASIAPDDASTTGILGLDGTGTKVYMYDSRGRDTSALTLHDLKTDAVQVLYEDPRVDMTDTTVLFHPTENVPQAAGSIYDRLTWTVLDERIAADFAYLTQLDDGDMGVVSRTLDDRLWIVRYEKDNGSARYYRYHRDEEQAVFMFSERPALEGFPLARMHPVVIPSRDGLSLVSYLTLPPWHEPASGIRPAEPLPMVLQVHGGPWWRDFWGWNPVHQWLANRGYGVLSVNFRGSTGFGKTFVNAGNREWGGKMHDDLVDAVQWAVDNGIADPDRICIAGRSYGGYAALAGLTFTPDLFACGISVVGPSNVVTLMDAIPPYWEGETARLVREVGDFRTPEGRAFLLERSPLTHAHQVRRPLLVLQGAHDPRVNKVESEQMVAAVQEQGVPVTYVLYPDEGHWFVRPANLISSYAVQETFLRQHLGGRFEPFGDDFAGSSITVPVGAEEIRGLPEALAQHGQ